MKVAFLVIASSVMLSACGTYVQSSVDSIARPEASERKIFMVAPLDKTVDPTGIEFESYARHVENALIEMGYVKASNISELEVAVLLGYSVGNPRTEVSTYSIPTYGQTGVSSSTTYGTVSRNGTYSATTNYVPTYGVTGSTPVVSSGSVYPREIKLIGLDYPSLGNDRIFELWQTTIYSEGSNPNLREVFPYMIEAAKPYIGTELTSSKVISIHKKN